MVIRKATAADVDAVAKIYLQAHDEIEKGNLFTEGFCNENHYAHHCDNYKRHLPAEIKHNTE